MHFYIFFIQIFCFSFAFSHPLINKMTLEEKVGQVMMVHFYGEVGNAEAEKLIRQINVGGIIYYNWSNGLHSPQQVQALSQSLQNLSRDTRLSIPLLIAVDQEGGAVARLTNGFTVFPGNKAIGMTGDSNLAKEAACTMGKELFKAGINLNFAPVADINGSIKPVLETRCFGDNPEIVIAFAQKALEGYREAGILSTLKHFPGHGSVEIDSHFDLPLVLKSMEELRQVDLLPFAKLASEADAIMTAHLLVPAFDRDNCSTLSKKTLSYLREKIGFKGMIVTDSLVMEGVLKKCGSVAEAAILALNAGCDLLLLGGKQLHGEKACYELTVEDIARIHKSIVDAVKSGRILETRLDEAIEKILLLKNKLTL
ncbi:MAG: beta-N-acetylhexosaminidase [Candidatus Protochlamydia sp.]|nr:beta-N-acetylhexosaminidase [Candidatus Protochlamydia sp.]